MILDSSGLIALTNVRDAHSQEARGLIVKNPKATWILHEVSLAESLVRASENDSVAEVLTLISALGVELEGSVGVEGALRVAQIRMKSRLPLPDCYVLDAALVYKLPLVSFDKKLNIRAREMGIETIF